MIRRLLIFILPVTMLLTGMMVVIRARPYDDAGLRAFLIPEDCPAPCWQGIRPGLMTIDKALALLRGHAWIQDVDTSLYDGFRGWIRWEWTGHEPDWIVPSGQDNLWIDQNLVVKINLRTTIRFGDIWLLLGAPDWTNTYHARGAEAMVMFNAYHQGTLFVNLNMACTQGMERLWFAPAHLVWPIFLPEGGEIVRGSPKLLSTCE